MQSQVNLSSIRDEWSVLLVRNPFLAVNVAGFLTKESTTTEGEEYGKRLLDSVEGNEYEKNYLLELANNLYQECGPEDKSPSRRRLKLNRKGQKQRRREAEMWCRIHRKRTAVAAVAAVAASYQ